MDAYGVVLTVVVMVLVAVAILLFEKKRATRIERDLKQMSHEQQAPRPDDEGPAKR